MDDAIQEIEGYLERIRATEHGLASCSESELREWMAALSAGLTLALQRQKFDLMNAIQP